MAQIMVRQITEPSKTSSIRDLVDTVKQHSLPSGSDIIEEVEAKLANGNGTLTRFHRLLGDLDNAVKCYVPESHNASYSPAENASTEKGKLSKIVNSKAEKEEQRLREKLFLDCYDAVSDFFYAIELEDPSTKALALVNAYRAQASAPPFRFDDKSHLYPRAPSR